MELSMGDGGHSDYDLDDFFFGKIWLHQKSKMFMGSFIRLCLLLFLSLSFGPLASFYYHLSAVLLQQQGLTLSACWFRIHQSSF